MGKNIKFGTDGWRAVIAEDFTFKNVKLVALAIAEYLKKNNLDKKGVLVGYDNRFLSKEFSKQAGYALSSKGFKVYLSKESVPTPVVAFMLRELNLDGAVMITASHNPPEYNGIKFIPYYGCPAGDKITKEIEKNLTKLIVDKNTNITDFRDTEIKRFEDNFKYVSNLDSYKIKIQKMVDEDLIKKSNLKLVADTMHGSGSKVLPEILKDNLGLEAKILHSDRDPLFGGMLPDPSESNLDLMKNEILKNNLDLGVALDGDADRFGVIDGKGIFISPNNVIPMIFYHLLKTRKFDHSDIAVRTVATTHLIDEICKKNKIKLLETPVGFKHIGREMLNNNVIIGGEESGGLSIKNHVPEKDGILADILLIEIQSFLKKNYDSKKYLSDYLNEIYNEFGTFYNTRIDIKIPTDKKDSIIGFFSSQKNKLICGKKVIDTIDKDGVKLLIENKSWILIRPSGTEPLIRCYIEAIDKMYFETIKNFVKQNIKNLTN